jgi:hypothetical protein
MTIASSPVPAMNHEAYAELRKAFPGLPEPHLVHKLTMVIEPDTLPTFRIWMYAHVNGEIKVENGAVEVYESKMVVVPKEVALAHNWASKQPT